MLTDFQISELRTLLNNVTPSILCKNLILDACTCEHILLVMPYCRCCLSMVHTGSKKRTQSIFAQALTRILNLLTCLSSRLEHFSSLTKLPIFQSWNSFSLTKFDFSVYTAESSTICTAEAKFNFFCTDF